MYPIRMAYMEVLDNPKMRMAGKGAPSDTLFGVIGRVKEDPYSKSLGGLVVDTKSKGVGKPPVKSTHKALDVSEHHIAGHSATAIPGAHYGQVPYAGVYMKAVGKRL